jgi:hypothetical protein
MAKTVSVTAAQVRAAQMLRRRAKSQGQDVAASVSMIADAKPDTDTADDSEAPAESKAADELNEAELVSALHHKLREGTIVVRGSGRPSLVFPDPEHEVEQPADWAEDIPTFLWATADRYPPMMSFSRSAVRAPYRVFRDPETGEPVGWVLPDAMQGWIRDSHRAAKEPEEAEAATEEHPAES